MWGTVSLKKKKKKSQTKQNKAKKKQKKTTEYCPNPNRANCNTDILAVNIQDA